MKKYAFILIIALIGASIATCYFALNIRIPTEVWRGNLQLTSDKVLAGSDYLLIDGAVVKFDDGVWGDPNPGPNWYGIIVKDNAVLKIVNGANLTGKVMVWSYNQPRIEYIGLIECRDHSTVTIIGSMVGRLYDLDSSTVKVFSSEIYALYHRTELAPASNGSYKVVYKASSIAPVVRDNLVGYEG